MLDYFLSEIGFKLYESPTPWFQSASGNYPYYWLTEAKKPDFDRRLFGYTYRTTIDAAPIAVSELLESLKIEDHSGQLNALYDHICKDVREMLSMMPDDAYDDESMQMGTYKGDSFLIAWTACRLSEEKENNVHTTLILCTGKDQEAIFEYCQEICPTDSIDMDLDLKPTLN